jgi:hypothetical protein
MRAYEFMSAVWAAARARLQRRRHLPAPIQLRPVPTCCSQMPCGCRPDGGDAA